LYALILNSVNTVGYFNSLGQGTLYSIYLWRKLISQGRL